MEYLFEILAASLVLLVCCAIFWILDYRSSKAQREYYKSMESLNKKHEEYLSLLIKEKENVLEEFDEQKQNKSTSEEIKKHRKYKVVGR